MDTALVIAIALAFIGVGLGWFLGSRQAAALRAERDQRLEDFRKAIADLAAAEERAKAVPALTGELETLRREHGDARAEVARLSSAQAERERAHADQLAELKAAREALTAQFSEIGGKLLGEAQENFLKRADARFHQAGEKSEAQLKALLQPVETTLKRYEEGLGRVEKERVGSYRELREAVELVRAGQTQVRDETVRLVNALRHSPKSRGRWGEQSLRNVLEQAGLSPHADFQSEVSVDTGDGRLRPDVIVRLPGGRKIIIDAKCSLNAFLDASEAVDEAVRIGHLKAHAGSIRTHAQQLGGKAYWQQFGDAADYVVMYIPGEHFLTAALEQDEGLWEWAFERRVLLATPTNLVAIARTVASVWRQETLAEEAAEIGRLGKELHARLWTMGEHIRKLGRNLNLATDAYNAFAGSIESQVLTQAKRFETLEVATGGKEIEPLPVIDSVPRALTKFGDGTAEAAE
ncbi:DNA recombination protein RmuC [Allosphingosinicella indica]|uniref:DNA recombination protein RmuC homolog n=1 Tax=Allosphingosinicella indica TaxID=941907 RepID=A0A1X7GVV5_9SPHN|nr:DNA recombination protein RmuC [Allosphingosinicella indica]SMF75558.1 DNA recombination protein RmuC [Allosphingosinicella indica]